MLSFRIGTMYSPEANSDVLAAWELAAFFLEDATPEELPLDLDEAREWYIENAVDSEMQSDYRAEPQMAEDEMLEGFKASLVALGEERRASLGIHYPFDLDEFGRLVRKGLADITPVGAAYMSLQFFRGMHAGTLEIEGQNDADVSQGKFQFDRLFRKVFEYIAGYAVAGRKDGATYMTSDCRSSSRLSCLLGRLCSKVGAGQVLPYANWNIVQRNANDGGVDCLIHVGGPQMPGDAHFLLVGATVQRQSIDGKIMGPDKLDFFGRFFSERPAAFQGALVRPQDEDPLTKLKCVERNCLLFTYDQIWQGMGRRDAGAYQSSALVRLDAKTRRLLRELLSVTLIHDFNEHNLQVV